MDVQIINSTRSAGGSRHIELACGKVSAIVSVMSYGVQVVCQNASHRCWRGGGKFFHTAEAAIANYKSGEMKAIIQAAVEFASKPVLGYSLPLEQLLTA